MSLTVTYIITKNSWMVKLTWKKSVLSQKQPELAGKNFGSEGSNNNNNDNKQALWKQNFLKPHRKRNKNTNVWRNHVKWIIWLAKFVLTGLFLIVWQRVISYTLPIFFFFFFFFFCKWTQDFADVNCEFSKQFHWFRF